MPLLCKYEDSEPCDEAISIVETVGVTPVKTKLFHNDRRNKRYFFTSRRHNALITRINHRFNRV